MDHYRYGDRGSRVHDIYPALELRAQEERLEDCSFPLTIPPHKSAIGEQAWAAQRVSSKSLFCKGGYRGIFNTRPKITTYIQGQLKGVMLWRMVSAGVK